MQILTEIIELSNGIVDTLEESGFFEKSLFVEKLPLKIKLQEKMQRKWEEQNEMLLTDDEFIKICNEVKDDSISSVLGDLVEKGAVNMSISDDGEIIYSANKNFDINEF